MRAIFQAEGTFPEDNDKLKTLLRDGVISAATAFKSLPGIPSGPLAFETSILLKQLSTSFSDSVMFVNDKCESEFA